MRPAVLALVLVAACGDEHPYACFDDTDCVANGSEGVCTLDSLCAFSDPTCADGFRYHESADALGGQCVGGPATGTAGAPFPLEARQTVDLKAAHDSIAPSCSIPGGRDVYFQISLQDAGRLYVDTLGTDFPHVLAFYRGICSPNAAEQACVTAACSDRFQQWSDILSSGTYCFVVDEAGSGGGTKLVVRSMLGPPVDLGDITTLTGNTCDEDFYEATCAPVDTPEAGWFFMSCGTRSLAITTSPTPNFSGILEAMGAGGDELACAAGKSGVTVTQPAGPLWIAAEATSQATCGPITIDVAQLSP